MRFTIKDDKPYAYTADQYDLLDKRVKDEGHSEISQYEANAIANPAESKEDALERAKSYMRAVREPMLSAVTGIGWDASVSGDTALAQEARDIRNALRDITDDPALNAAQTYEEMREAGEDAFRRIASGASEAFSATFREFK